MFENLFIAESINNANIDIEDEQCDNIKDEMSYYGHVHEMHETDSVPF